MDLPSLLRWWDEWQLSVLVLGSLGVKCFLAVAAGSRRSNIGSVYRFLIWLCYLGGDGLAIYALAALLNIQKKAAQESYAPADSRALQLLWAPIMLMHLGGLANISAYNLEDNDLWRRHIVTSVSQVAISLYVFCKMWSSTADKRLLAAAILLFIPGVFKCFEKPIALRRSSFYNQVSQTTKKSSAAELSLEDYIKAAKNAASGARGIVDELDSEEGYECLKALSGPDKLFVDVARTYSERARASELFWDLTDDLAQHVVSTGISNTFNLLYTKDFTKARKAWKETRRGLLCSFATWILCLLVPLPAIGLLHSGRKEAYRRSDVKITFVLLYATLLVDFCSIFSLDVSPWHGKVTQHNLMELLDRNRRRPWVTAVARHLGCTELLGHRLFFRMEPCDSSPPREQQPNWRPCVMAVARLLRCTEKLLGQRSSGGSITSAVRCHVRAGLKEYIRDAESYTSFGDLRGQWTLRREGCDQRLLALLDRPFDEAVLIWHLATDLYRSLSPDDSEGDKDARLLATRISNNMMHLLFANAEMLMPGSRTYLCTTAYRGIEAIFNEGEQEDKKDKERTVADRLLGFLYTPPEPPAETKEVNVEQEAGKRFVYDAWNLAHALQNLTDDAPAHDQSAAASSTKKALRVLRGVWVEMLCFSAIRCRGYLHAKSLGSGGEYLTFVWLLLAHAGLETLPERQQRFRMTQLLPRATKYADKEPAAAAATHPPADHQNL